MRLRRHAFASATFAMMALAGFAGAFAAPAVPGSPEAPAALPALPTGPTGAPGERWIVGFYDLPADAALDGSYAGARIVGVTEGLDFLVVEPLDFAAFQARVRADPAVRYIEYDDPHYARLNFVPNDSLYGNSGHWGSKKIGAEAAWDATRGSTAVKLATIDSGLFKGHEEYSGQSRVLQGWDYAYGDSDPADEGLGCAYHGTHTAGTAGATIHNNKGIAGLSQHSILPVKALKINIPLVIYCTGGTSWLANALKFAADQGAHIASNSWGGGGSSTTLNDAIAYAHDKGVTLVASAGNDGSCNNCVGQPWKDNGDKVVVVSCSTSSDAFCSFSSQGPQVDVAAPGDNIISSCGAGTASYCTYDGTSMSAPHVAGTLALVKALNPSFGYAQLDKRIKDTALDLGAAGKDDKFGYGRVSAAAAVY